MVRKRYTSLTKNVSSSSTILKSAEHEKKPHLQTKVGRITTTTTATSTASSSDYSSPNVPATIFLVESPSTGEVSFDLSEEGCFLQTIKLYLDISPPSLYNRSTPYNYVGQNSRSSSTPYLGVETDIWDWPSDEEEGPLAHQVPVTPKHRTLPILVTSTAPTANDAKFFKFEDTFEHGFPLFANGENREKAASEKPPRRHCHRHCHRHCDSLIRNCATCSKPFIASRDDTNTLGGSRYEQQHFHYEYASYEDMRDPFPLSTRAWQHTV